ncbi:hypothetical protein CRG98_045611 [Punica granatum]|uniref:Uncharacterized protein n=1 Tax=Punica granatum TaxID=22663 RepID=A0A2I0HQX9_PUNGR|nr:hypothetical protein CRG98_045611 [Punica granatum]
MAEWRSRSTPVHDDEDLNYSGDLLDCRIDRCTDGLQSSTWGPRSSLQVYDAPGLSSFLPLVFQVRLEFGLFSYCALLVVELQGGSRLPLSFPVSAVDSSTPAVRHLNRAFWLGFLTRARSSLALITEARLPRSVSLDICVHISGRIDLIHEVCQYV